MRYVYKAIQLEKFNLDATQRKEKESETNKHTKVLPEHKPERSNVHM